MFKILVVEDDIKLRALFGRALTKNGYAVTCASNGREAIDRILSISSL